MKKLRAALAQINTTVGDLSGNSRKILSYIERAKKAQADIVVFPELAVTGYPPEDLLLKEQFIRDNIDVLDQIAGASEGIIAVTGFVDRGDTLYNAAAVISDRKIAYVYHKKLLPNYGVFDECRYFSPGTRFPVFRLGDVRFGVNICEDIWHDKGPALVQSLAGAEIIFNMNASPYHAGKIFIREEMLASRARECGSVICYVNMIGGQDELVFDGGSLIAASDGTMIRMGRQFKEDLIIEDIILSDREGKLGSRKGKGLSGSLKKGEVVEEIELRPPKGGKKRMPPGKRTASKMTPVEEIYHALLTGTQDYVRKNGFREVVIGLSGGVDSSLVAAVAADAIGKDNVHGLFMPSEYTSKESREDAYALARNLGISIRMLPIDPVLRSYLRIFSESFRGSRPDITEENLQARIRGNMLMAFSNKFGWLVLTTGNKSEMSVGYATLYGDMAGGFAVIKDVPKTLVYELCEWKNARVRKPVIPLRVLQKAPTAELRPGQKDTDSLPPYPVLDPILKAYVEEDRSYQEIVDMDHDPERVRKVIRMVDLAEYKRRQAPPGVKITPRAFGKDRRFPITNRYRSY